MKLLLSIYLAGVVIEAFSYIRHYGMLMKTASSKAPLMPPWANLLAYAIAGLSICIFWPFHFTMYRVLRRNP